jgi:hypothetical protein
MKQTRISNYTYKSLILLLLLNACVFVVKAQSGIKIQNTAVPFLLISPDSKSAGMANTNLGMTPNTNDLFQNAAKIANLQENSGFSLNYTPWLKDIGLENVYLLNAGYYKKINQTSAYHASIKYFTLGTIDLTNENGIPNLPSQKTGEFSIDAGYSLKLSNNISLGTSLKYIHSKLIQGNFNGLEYNAGNSIAGDISLYYQQHENAEGLHVGMMLSNLGSKMSYANNNKKYFLPANMGIGLGYVKNIDEKNGIEFGIDANRLLVPSLANNATQEDIDAYYAQSVFNSWFSSFSGNNGISMGSSYNVSGGVEYNYDKVFYLRTGYHFEKTLNAGNTEYYTTGTTIKYNNMKFHLSYILPTTSGVARNPLSNTFSFGTSIHLN